MRIYLDDGDDGVLPTDIHCRDHFQFMHAVKDNIDCLDKIEFSFDYHLGERDWTGHRLMCWLIEKAQREGIDLTNNKVSFHSRDEEKASLMERDWFLLVHNTKRK